MLYTCICIYEPTSSVILFSVIITNKKSENYTIGWHEHKIIDEKMNENSEIT